MDVCHRDVAAYPRVVIASARQTSRTARIRSLTMIGMAIPRMTGLTSWFNKKSSKNNAIPVKILKSQLKQ
jgi:hypothetical protein